MAREQDEAAAKKDVPAPEGLPEDPRLLAAKIVAEVDLKDRLKQVQREIDAEQWTAEAKAKEQGRAEVFHRAYHDWLNAKAGMEDSSIEEDDVAAERDRVQVEAERRIHYHARSLRVACMAEVRGIRGNTQRGAEGRTEERFGHPARAGQHQAGHLKPGTLSIGGGLMT